MTRYTIHQGDTLETLGRLPDESVHTVVTSPPYFGLRSYLPDDHPDKEKEIGTEATPDEFVDKLVRVFREVRRVLRDDGTVWLNLGDSYAGSGKGRNADGSHQEGGKQGTSRGTIEGRLTKTRADDCKPKDLIGIPWRVAFALRADGWYLRQDIIWHKSNPMPESVTDRCTKAHEYIFLLSKSKRYHYDHEAIKEPAKQDWGTRDRTNGKYHNEGSGLTPHSGLEKSYKKANKRSVWKISTKPYKGAHFATFPPDLIEPCILAGAPEGGVVLDPFGGSGTTAEVALKHRRRAILCELNPEYVKLTEERLTPLLEQLSLFD